MLLSMTGYGEARLQSDALNLAIELRSVNNRYLKISFRATEPYHLLEAEFEKVIRRTIKRGTVQVHLHCQRQYAAQDFVLNPIALRSYVEQLRQVCSDLDVSLEGSGVLGQVLALPGVVPEPGLTPHALQEQWPIIEKLLEQALAKLQAMRLEEGKAMAAELLAHRTYIVEQLEHIRRRAPQVVEGYRDRLHERVRNLLSELDIEIDRKEIIKEVAIFAERSDIAEEVVRLASHLDQFQEMIQEPESPGRKLEFLTQEMFREANTIGSKASDVAIARQVVEIKGCLEKIRELVQNVE